MASLSELARVLLNRLYTQVPEQATILSVLAQRRKQEVIPYLVPLLLSPKREDRLAAGRAFDVVLAAMLPEDLVWLDQRLRQRRHPGLADAPDPRPWHELAPAALAGWEEREPARLSALRLAACHANGFVREEALRRLGRISDGSELPYLLLRLNDWVPAVRRQALAAVEARLRVEYAPHFVQNLALVEWLKQTRRGDQSAVLDAIARLLAEPACRPAVLAGLSDSSRWVRRACFRMTVEGESADLPATLLDRLCACDPLLRLWAARRVGPAMPAEERDRALAMMRRDHFLPVRREALRLAAQTLPADEARRLLMTALLDRSAALRAAARSHLRDRGEGDFAAMYRDALAAKSPPTLVAACLGLGETGAPEDADLLARYLAHELPQVRRAAVRGVARLDGDGYLPVLLRCVLDEAPGVSNEAQRALLPFASGLDSAELWGHFRASALFYVRFNLLGLLAALPKWKSIVYLVRATGDDDWRMAAQARDYVCRWQAEYNRSFAQPTRQDLDQLADALSESAGRLPADTLRELQFVARSFARV